MIYKQFLKIKDQKLRFTQKFKKLYPRSYSFNLSIRNFLFISVFIVNSKTVKSQVNEAFVGKELLNTVKLNFIPVEMPKAAFPNLKPTMGMMGLHYQMPLNNWLYTGAAMYMAVTGDQGGLFTLGITLGVAPRIYKNLYLDANLHFGGGGGYRYLVKDGAYINPNLGVKYKAKKFAFGIQYSHVNFYTGSIKSNTTSLFFEIPSILRYTNYRNASKNWKVSKLNTIEFWQKPVVKNAQQIRFDFFFPFGNSKKDNGTPLTEPLSVLGFEYQKYLNEKWFLYAHTDAIYKGLRAGFMDLFFGTGFHPYQSNYIDTFIKLGMGAAGGRVAPEGGAMIYPSMGFDLHLSNNLSLSGHGGYYRAIAGELETYTLGVGVKYKSLNGGTAYSEYDISAFKTLGITFSLENQSYFKVAKTDDYEGNLLADLQLLAIQFNYDITSKLYLIGEAGFAYSGRSGGYAHGLVGLGVRTPSFFKHKTSLFLDITGGAAGGAGVDTGEGIIIRPTVGINHQLSENFAITASGGKLFAPFGNVNATNINIGINFSFASLFASKYNKKE